MMTATVALLGLDVAAIGVWSVRLAIRRFRREQGDIQVRLAVPNLAALDPDGPVVQAPTVVPVAHDRYGNAPDQMV